MTQHKLFPLAPYPILLAVAISLFFALPSTAQGNEIKNEANDHFQKYHFKSANWQYLTQEQQDVWVLERIAHGFRLNHDTQNAEKYYALVVEKSYNPNNYLYYAQALQSNGKTELAKAFFLKYDRLVADSGDLRGRQFAQGIGSENSTHLPELTVKNLRELNSEQLDFSPAIHKNGLVFSSTRPTHTEAKLVDNWTGEAFSSLYFSEKTIDGALLAPVLFHIGPGNGLHTGPLVIDISAKRLYYTRSGARKKKLGTGEHFLKIASAVLDGNQWLHDTALDLGAQQCNDAHPAISPNSQQLVFASDRPGGFGGMDLYVSHFYGGVWGAPVNLGPGINTAGNEVFPFVHKNGDLFFASDGWGGLGGLDVFFSQASPDGYWSAAQPVGAPINSNMDDFGLVLDELGTTGYFTSARAGGLGKDDIYSFTAPYPLDRMLLADHAMEKLEDPVFSTNSPDVLEEKTVLFFSMLATASETGQPVLLNEVKYDNSAWHIGHEAASELELVARFLRSRPELSIELVAHTDAKGDAISNKEISEMRAQYAAHFLLQQGVATNRITAVGMGGDQPTNHCGIGVDCPDELHGVNRRVEVRFLK